MAGEIHHRLVGLAKDPAIAAFRSPFADPLRQIETVADIAEQFLKRAEVPQSFPGLAVLGNGGFQGLGLQRCHRSAAGFQQRHEPIQKPRLAPFTGLGCERVQARRSSGADFGVAAAKGANGHLETGFLVEDNGPTPCPLGLRREEGDGGGFAAAGFAQHQRVTIGRLGFRVTRFMETEPVQRALQRLKQRERRLPWQARGVRPGISGMQRRHIGEVQGRHRHVPRPVSHIAGVHREEGRLEGGDLADEAHAVLVRDAADAGDFGVERHLIPGKDRDGHLVDAEPKLATLGLVGGLKELGLNRGGDVLGGAHLGDPAFDPFGDAAALDRRVAVGDDGVAAGPERIEHPGPGRGRVGFDIEDSADAGRVCPLLHGELALAKVNGGCAGILGEDAKRAAGLGSQFAGQKRGVKADQAAIADLQAVGFDAKSGLKDRDHLAQLFQPPVSVFAPDLGRRLAKEWHRQRGNLPPDDRQDQNGVLQIAALQLGTPGPVDIGGKALAVDRFQLGLGRAHHPVQIEAEALIERVEQMREAGTQRGDRRAARGDPVDAGHLQRDHQPVVAGAHHLVIQLDDIRQMRIDLRIRRDQRLRPAPQPLLLKKHDAALSGEWPSASPAS